MAACYTHALSSTKRWGGEIDDYLPIHLWFDDPKNHLGDFRQRALRHHTLGIHECLTVFGEALTLSTGRVIPTRWVCEQHLVEDFGRIPTVQDWLENLEPRPWMARGARRLSTELESSDDHLVRGADRAEPNMHAAAAGETDSLDRGTVDTPRAVVA